MSKHHVLDIIAQRSPNYDWVRNNTVLLVRHGSHAYGTNTPASDVDTKGVCIPTREYFLGSQKKFEQAELKAPDPDTVVYEIRKFFNLAMANNPNCLEVLFVDPVDYLLVDPIGEILLDNKEKFLSKRIKHTTCGYAFGQLKRIKGHRRFILNPPKEQPTREKCGLPNQTLIPQDQMMAVQAQIQKEMDRLNFDFMEELNEPMKIAVRNTMSEMLAELKITSDQQWEAAARKVGLNDNFIEVMQKERAYQNAKTDWDQYHEWKANRNRDRYQLEEKYHYDTKHAGHLYRLLRVCREVLTTGKLIVKRPDREEILAIRNGAWTYDQLIEFAEKEERELNELYKTCTVLPQTPDFEYLDKLCIRLVEKSLSKYSWYNLRKRFRGV